VIADKFNLISMSTSYSRRFFIYIVKNIKFVIKYELQFFKDA